MPVLIEQDTNLKRVIASGTDADGNEYQETESVVYRKGQVVRDEDLTESTLEALENGDEDLARVAKVISEDEAEKIQAEQAGVGTAVIAEHEAEAEVLSQDGKDVATREEKIETNINGDVVAEEEVEVDLSEGREAKDPEDVRIKEVDENRRGDSPAPEPVPAAEEKKSSRKAASTSDADAPKAAKPKAASANKEAKSE